jgi:hypothetical protein
MSSDNSQNDTAQVLDEDNRTDKRLKDRILDARERVAEREDEIFVGARLDVDVNLDHDQLVTLWSTTVRQFLRTIEPLLRSDEIDISDHYYRELPIAEETLYPPDGPTKIVTDGEPQDDPAFIQWSLFYNDDISRREIIGSSDLFSREFEPPEPKPVELSGLKSVIEQETISVGWEVPLNPGPVPANKTHVAYPDYNHPLSKATLEYAVRKADEFLHNAGIGLEIGDPTKEATGDYSDIADIDTL